MPPELHVLAINDGTVTKDAAIIPFAIVSNGSSSRVSTEERSSVAGAQAEGQGQTSLESRSKGHSCSSIVNQKDPA